ncbi:MAG: ATP-binding protein, partial [Pseudomonadota bacterium]
IINAGNDNGLTRALIFLICLAYLLALAALILVQLASAYLARRERAAGSQLHLRLTGMFALIAFLPTVVVAVFATLMVNFGIERWFSDRVGSVIRNALITAEAYEREHLSVLIRNVELMQTELNQAAGFLNPEGMREYVREQSVARNLDEVFLFSSEQEILARGEFSYLFTFEPPTQAQMASARAGELVLIDDNQNGEIRALVHLQNFSDAYLYVTRDVQGDVLRLLDQTRETVQLYARLEGERDALLINYAVQYLGLALLIILAAILLGLWFAERLSRPMGRLVGAAEQIGQGNLEVRVAEGKGSDEISLLSRAFNRMTTQVKGQRDALISARDETERRRLFIEAVLSGVTAGVIGLDETGRVELTNAAAAELLGVEMADLAGTQLTAEYPAFSALLEAAAANPLAGSRGEVHLTLGGQAREFLVRVVAKTPGDAAEGFVLTFDDVTALASAQRMAAWGDVARRIAHEIKNPLTPIQLSADRMRRKFAGKLPDGEGLEQYLDVITRQAGDIRRMVDEFSKFARMPAPDMQEEDLTALVADALILQREGREDIDYLNEMPPRPVPIVCDRGLINQCLVNLMQNAADAIDARHEAGDAPRGRIGIKLTAGPRNLRLIISDNGPGLPEQHRDRLADPYVTHRKKGTGLGLAIVTKIIEQHGGELVLGDADGANGFDGAQISLRLPRPASSKDNRK